MPRIRTRNWENSHKDQIREYRRKWKNEQNRCCPEILTFENMRQRCNNIKAPNYKWYGARGIKVIYKSWHEMVNDIGLRPGKGYSIDRIDNNGNYEIGNCRWVTQKEQLKNRRAYGRTI